MQASGWSKQFNYHSDNVNKRDKDAEGNKDNNGMMEEKIDIKR